MAKGLENTVGMKWECYKAEYKQLQQNDNLGVRIIPMSTKINK